MECCARVRSRSWGETSTQRLKERLRGRLLVALYVQVIKIDGDEEHIKIPRYVKDYRLYHFKLDEYN
jgi:hypothetical protein